MNVNADSAVPPTWLDLAHLCAGGSLACSAHGGVRRTNVMALAVCEFAAAACHYPIVFTAGPTLPIAVLGWREGENSFTDGAGQWRRNVYVPASARRLLLRGAGGSKTCAERDLDQPTPWDVSESAESLDAQFEETRHFGVWLDANQMLETQAIKAELHNGDSCVLSGFALVNPARILSLTDTQVLELHRRGWLNLLHLHLQSLENWQRLNGAVRVDYLSV